MVSAVRRFLRAACAALPIACFASTDQPFQYRLGDVVSNDIVAPVSFQVMETENAARLPQEAEEKIPMIYRYHPDAADVTEKELHRAFGVMRTNLIRAMILVFKKRKLDAAVLETPRFKSFAAAFCQQHPTFPQLTNLVPIWATGGSDADLRALYAARLGESMKRLIRQNDTSSNAPAVAQIWLATNMNLSTNFEALTRSATMMPLTNLAQLVQVRTEFKSRYLEEDATAARFLTPLLKANCTAQTELTRRMRAQYVSERLVAENYTAGQLIARRGQKADAKTVAALNQLRAIHRLAPKPEENLPAALLWLYRLDGWYWAGFAAGIVGLAFGIWQLLKQKKSSALPARIPVEGIIVPPETLANTPHFAEWLNVKLAQALFADRQQLLEAQKAAAMELNDLERRLDELNAPLGERLRAYEKRISELEQLLAIKGEENRELLRAKIEMTRRQLENARSRTRLELN